MSETGDKVSRLAEDMRRLKLTVEPIKNLANDVSGIVDSIGVLSNDSQYMRGRIDTLIPYLATKDDVTARIATQVKECRAERKASRPPKKNSNGGVDFGKYLLIAKFIGVAIGSAALAYWGSTSL